MSAKECSGYVYPFCDGLFGVLHKCIVFPILIAIEFYAAVSSKDGYDICFSGLYNLCRINRKHFTSYNFHCLVE
jgi:hypothetical protein